MIEKLIYKTSVPNSEGQSVKICFIAEKESNDKYYYKYIYAENTDSSSKWNIPRLSIPDKIPLLNGEYEEIYGIRADVFQVVFYNRAPRTQVEQFFKANPNLEIIGTDKHIIERIVIDPGISFIDEGAFESVQTKLVFWPKNCECILKGTFQGCKLLQKVVGIDHIKMIQPYAFAETGIELFDWPENSKVIPSYCFANTFNLKEVSVKGILKTVGVCAFYNTKIASLTLTNPNCMYIRVSETNKIIVYGPIYLTCERF